MLVEEDAVIDGKKVQTGHTKEYIKIALDAQENLRNCIVNVQIDNGSPNYTLNFKRDYIKIVNRDFGSSQRIQAAVRQRLQMPVINGTYRKGGASG